MLFECRNIIQVDLSVYFVARLKRLLSVAYWQSEIAAQRIMPRSIETAPLSIAPMMPKQARKRASERAVFSIFMAAVQVSMPIMAQTREMNPSPKRREGIAVSLLVFVLYPVFSKYAFIVIPPLCILIPFLEN